MNTEVSPVLNWPDGWERTRINDRKTQGQWKRTTVQYREALFQELRKHGASDVLLTLNQDPVKAQQDPAVAVYFSRQAVDFSWQDALGIENPAPTVHEIDTAFKKKAMMHHPDRVAATGEGDPEIFKLLDAHRKRAVAWVKGEHTKEHEYVIPCDKFKEQRLNIAAIRMALAAMRQLERCGVPAILERSFRGFRTALPAMASTEVGDAGAT